MSQIDRLLEEIWAETDASATGVESGAPARSAETFALTVMEAIARRRLRADLATRFALVVALLATASALAPAISHIQQSVVAAEGAGALTAGALIVAAALSVGAAVRRWPSAVTRA